MKSFRNRVKDVLGREQCTAKRDGRVIFKRPYFYRPMSLDEWGDRIRTKLREAGIEADVALRDRWEMYPKNSYFQATITEKKGA